MRAAAAGAGEYGDIQRVGYDRTWAGRCAGGDQRDICRREQAQGDFALINPPSGVSLSAPPLRTGDDVNSCCMRARNFCETVVAGASRVVLYAERESPGRINTVNFPERL